VLIVGGGQLARMMAQAAISLEVRVRILTSPGETSVSDIAETHLGDYYIVDDVLKAAQGMDVITFDHEHVPQDVLTELVGAGLTVRPNPAALTLVQNKLVLRRKLESWGIAQPRWLGGAGAPLDVIHEFIGAGGVWPVVLKSATGGYDGRGVWVLHDEDSARELTSALAADKSQPHPSEWLVEQFCVFERELSAQVARSPHGQGLAYQVVQTVQNDGICVEVIAPAPELPESVAISAQRMALDIAARTDMAGMLAVELFLMPDQSLLVNELAMRPHNSGHWSIDGAVTSQFENHLRAILNLPLGSVRPLWPTCVMANVIGTAPTTVQALESVLAHDPGLKVHMYGKEFRPGRKLGHVTAGDENPERASVRARHGADVLSGTIG
jgi:5-(carboxyamino)imidazole ribonucleotide synthase